MSHFLTVLVMPYGSPKEAPVALSLCRRPIPTRMPSPKQSSTVLSMHAQSTSSAASLAHFFTTSAALSFALSVAVSFVCSLTASCVPSFDTSFA